MTWLIAWLMLAPLPPLPPVPMLPMGAPLSLARMVTMPAVGMGHDLMMPVQVQEGNPDHTEPTHVCVPARHNGHGPCACTITCQFDEAGHLAKTQESVECEAYCFAKKCGCHPEPECQAPK